MEQFLASSAAPGCTANSQEVGPLRQSSTNALDLDSWYLGEPRSECPTDTVIKAFHYAKQFHEANFKQDNGGESWLSKSSSMSDVLEVLYESQDRYNKRIASRSKKVKTMGTWWKVAASRINHYHQIVDTFVSSHPEYAALVWGAFRFLFQVTLNQEELSIKIAQAVAEIGSVLPEIDFVAHKLYPIKAIQRTFADAYAHIVNFCIQATKWYRDVTRSRARKLWHAIANPWPLEFQGTKMAIDTCLRRLREQAAVAHQTETRAIHAKVCKVLTIAPHGNPSRCQPDLRYDAYMSTGCLEDTGAGENLRVVISFESIAKCFDSLPIDASKSVKTGLVLRDRRRVRGRELHGAVWNMPALHQWISSPKSAVLRVDSPFARQDATIDFSLDIMEMAQLAKVPVITYLSIDMKKGTVSISDVLRSLTLQIIGQNQGILSKAIIQNDKFVNSDSFADWLHLLVALVSSLPRLALVIDARDNSEVILNMVSHFKENLDANNAGVVLKVMVLTRELSADTASALLIPWAGCSGELQVCNNRELGSRPVRYSSRGPSYGSRSRAGGSEEAKRSLLAAWS